MIMPVSKLIGEQIGQERAHSAELILLQPDNVIEAMPENPNTSK